MSRRPWTGGRRPFVKVQTHQQDSGSQGTSHIRMALAASTESTPKDLSTCQHRERTSKKRQNRPASSWLRQQRYGVCVCPQRGGGGCPQSLSLYHTLSTLNQCFAVLRELEPQWFMPIVAVAKPRAGQATCRLDMVLARERQQFCSTAPAAWTLAVLISPSWTSVEAGRTINIRRRDSSDCR